MPFASMKIVKKKILTFFRSLIQNSPSFNGRFARLRFLRPYPVPNQQCRATGNRRIGHVKCEQKIAPVMHLYEIDHRTEKYPVNQVTNSTAQNHAQRKTKQFLLGIAPQQPHCPCRRHYCDSDKKEPLPAASIGKHAKCSTAIMHAHHIKK